MNALLSQIGLPDTISNNLATGNPEISLIRKAGKEDLLFDQLSTINYQLSSTGA
jgi:hypothetical protein